MMKSEIWNETKETELNTTSEIVQGSRAVEKCNLEDLEPKSTTEGSDIGGVYWS